ncbi:MAG: hypothetical protein ACI97P_001259 [Arcticibacterium sp.]|jgi:hypothetical protein
MPKTQRRWFKVISKYLNPDGRFVTINSHPNHKGPVETMPKYGFTRENER